MDSLIEEARTHLTRRSQMANELQLEADLTDLGRHPCPVFACWKHLDKCRVVFFPATGQQAARGAVSYAIIADDPGTVQVAWNPPATEPRDLLESHAWGRPLVYRYERGMVDQDDENAMRVVEYLGRLHAATRTYYARLDAAARFSRKVMELREAGSLDADGLDESALHSGLLVLFVSALEAGLRDVFQAFPEARFEYLADDQGTAKKTLRRILKALVRDQKQQRQMLREARRGGWSAEALRKTTEPIIGPRTFNFQNFSKKRSGAWAYRQFLGISLSECAYMVRTDGWDRLRSLLLDRHRVAHAFEEADLSRETLVQDIDGARRFFGNVLLRTLHHIDIDRTAKI